jgi:hypothetical protein
MLAGPDFVRRMSWSGLEEGAQAGHRLASKPRLQTPPELRHPTKFWFSLFPTSSQLRISIPAVEEWCENNRLRFLGAGKFQLPGPTFGNEQSCCQSIFPYQIDSTKLTDDPKILPVEKITPRKQVFHTKPSEYFSTRNIYPALDFRFLFAYYFFVGVW